MGAEMTDKQLIIAQELYDGLGLPELVDPADESGCLELIAAALAEAEKRGWQRGHSAATAAIRARSLP